MKGGKEWTEITLPNQVREAHTKPIHAIAWGPCAAFCMTASADRTLKTFGTSS